MLFSSPRLNRRGSRFQRPLVELLEDRCLLSATVTESFDYVADELLHGQNGGAGFSDAWQDNNLRQTNAVTIAAGSLAYPGLTTHGNRVLVSSTGFIDRTLTAPLGPSDTTRYFSFLLRPDSAINPDASVGLGIRGDTNIFVGKPSVGDSTAYVLEAFGGAGQVSTGRPAVQGETVLLVVRADFGPGTDTLRLYVNPAVGQPEPANADATLSAFDLGAIYALQVNSFNNPDMAASMDEVRVGATYADVTPAAAIGNPISWWQAEENANDSAGSNHGARLAGADFAPGRIGQAFLLDGVDDSIEIPDSASLTTPSAITLAAWVYAEATTPAWEGGFRVIASKYNNSHDGATPGHDGEVSWDLAVNEFGQFVFVVYADPTGFSGHAIATQVPMAVARQWQHVAATFDTATQDMRIYINGLVAPFVTLNQQQSGPITTIADSDTPIRIGRTHDNRGTWDGLIDEVLIYGQALRASEVQAVYNSYPNTAPSDVVLDPMAAINEGGAATLTGRFTDPDAGQAHTVFIDWGDDSTATTLDLEPGVFTFSAPHTWLDNPPGQPAGQYTMRVTVLDDTGASSVGPPELLVSSYLDNSILSYDVSTGQFLDVFVAANSGGLHNPAGLAIGPDGNLYAGSASTPISVLRYHGQTGEFLDAFVPPGSGGLNYPHNLTFGPDGNLYVSSYATQEVLRYDGRTGAFLDVFVAGGSGGLHGPTELVFGPDGNLYLGSFNTDEVLRYDGETGTFLDAFVTAGSGGLNGTHGLAFGPDGHLYVSSNFTGSVLRYQGDTGAFLGALVPSGLGGLGQAGGLGFGPDGKLYVVSSEDDAVLRFDGSTGGFLDSIAGGGLDGPTFFTFHRRAEATSLAVHNVAPGVISIRTQSGFLPGASAAINLGAFVDPGADSPWTVEVDWGEPNVLPESFSVASPGSLGKRGHTYAAPGLYMVTVTVTDKDGAAGSSTIQVLVGLQVINTADTGFGTLRQAMLDANSLPGLDTITFNIPAGDGRHFYYRNDGVAGQVSLAQVGVTNAVDDATVSDIDPDWPHSWWSIQPASALPLLNDRVTIDGATQGAGTPLAAVANSNGPGLGINAVLRVEVAGNGLAANGLSFVGGGSAFGTGSTVRGLVINGFGLRGIRSNGGGNTIQGNFLGTDPSGGVAKANLRGGILLTISHFNYIGTDGNGFNDAAERNLISGNGGADFGSALQVQSSADNVIAGNFVGVDRSGAKALGNFAAAITLFANGANRNRIGTDGNGLADDLERNIISASHGSLGSNQPWGVQLVNGVTNNVVAGNFIGTDVTGAQALGNGNWGLLIANASNNRVGIDPNHANFPAERNVISGNALGGVALGINASGNTIWGNYLGTQADGTSPLGNVGFGVGIGSGASNNQIGGPGAKANIIAFNTGPGVSLAHQTIALGASAPTLDNPPATGNVARGNVLHSNGALGIDLGATFNFNTYVSAWNGPTSNDSADADDGPNRYQNHPVLQAARAGAATRLIGTLNSLPSTTFTLDFYANAATSFGADGVAEGQRYLGSVQVTTDAGGNANFDSAIFAVPLAASANGEWITATATDASNNTSEFSSAVEAQSFVVTTTANDGFGSLRQVILAANQSPGKDTITFAIPTTDPGYNSLSGTFTIRPTSALPIPVINDPVNLDATTQPGYAETPLIELDGSGAGGGADGFLISAGDSSVRGFVINRFASGAGVHVIGQGNVVIQGNYIGTNVTGTDLPNVGPLIRAYEFNASYADALGGPAITPVGGTLSGGAYIWADVPGNNHGLTLANALPSGDNYSIEMVFRFDQLSSYQRIIDFKNRTSDQGLYSLGTALNFYNVASGPSGVFVVDADAHVVLTRNGVTRQVVGYVNGIQQFSFTDTNNLAAFTGPNNVVHLFLDNTQSSAPDEISGGAVDRIRIYNRPLTSTEVSTIFSGGSVSDGGRTNRFGVRIENAPDNVVGTNGDGNADVGERNLISGNDYGVNISGAGAQRNRVAGNYLGTNAAGISRLAQNFFPTAAIVIDGAASNNVIGTNGDGVADAAERNLISGNGNGVNIAGAADNVVAGNVIGPNVAGAAILGSGYGVVIQGGSTGNRIGTNGDGLADAAEANLISGNSSVGVSITSPGTVGNVVAGNFIGTNAAGDAPRANSFGIIISGFASGNRIGTSGESINPVAERNLISGNGTGIMIGDQSGVTQTNDNVIAGNFIGTTATGDAAIANGVGILIQNGSGNRVGTNSDGNGDGAEANVIAFNTQSGVNVLGNAALGNAIRGNKIYDNGGLGIDLGADGVTANDFNDADADAGANNLQNFPELTSAVMSLGNTTIAGALNSAPNAAFLLDFYANAAPDQPDGHGEGRSYVGSMSVTTDADGNATFVKALPAMLAGKYITATATDAGKNTSEFSRAVRVLSAVSISLTASANPIVFGESVTFHATVSADTPGIGMPTGQVQLLENGQVVDSKALVGGAASFTISNLAVGSRPFTINYLGDADFLPGSGPTPALNMTINQANSTLVLSSSAANNTAPFGQPVTFTATVSAQAPSDGTPTGTVVFYVGSVNNVLGSAPLAVVSGVNRAVFTTSSLTVGQHTILATYLGDANHLTSGASLTQTIEPDPNAPKQLLVTSAADPDALTPGTLRHALSIANTDAANGISDTILFDTIQMGTRTISLQVGQLDLGRAGGGTVTIDGAGQITVSAGGANRIFRVSSGARAVVNGLTVQSGIANGGGGFRNEDNASLTITNSTIAGNTANGGGGGGIWNVGTLTISNSTLVNNAANGNTSGGNFGGSNYIYPVAGGAIWNHGALTVVNSTIAQNSAAGKNIVGAPSGGGVWNNGDLVLNGVTISGNSATDGGGLFSYATLTLQNTLIAGNTAAAGVPDAKAPVTAASSFNLIGNGTGLTGIFDGPVNRVGTASAPIDPRLGPLTDNGGTTRTFALLADSPAILRGGSSTTLSAPMTTATTSIQVVNAGMIARTPGRYVVRIDNEQLLVTAAANNALTVMRGYGGTSPAAHGTGASVFLAEDQRGVTRGIPSDVGAYQSPVPSNTTFTVTKAEDTLMAGTLRDAVAKANANAARGISSTINFDVAQMGSDTIVLDRGQFALFGSGGGLTTIDGGGRVTIDGANASRAFWIGAGTRAVITGMTIQAGRATGDTFTYNGSGGGIFNLGALTLVSSTLRGNSAFNGGGGGIFNLGTLTVTASTFSDNSATGRRFSTASTVQETGAIWPISGGAIWNGGALTLSNSTLAHNFAKGSLINVANPGQAFGGGIFNSATLVVTSSTISANRAEVENPAGQASGGGLFGTVTLQNTIVAGNIAPTDPDISAQASGGYNLIGNGAGLTGIANIVNFNRVGIDPRLAPFDLYAAPTQTFALLPDSPAIRAGGAATTLTMPVDASAVTLKVALPSAIASTAGSHLIRIDAEQMLVTSVQGSDTLTVVRGQNGTAQVAHSAGTGVYLVVDQGGAPRSIPPHIGADETQLLLGAVAGRNYNAVLTAPEGLLPTIYTLTSGSLPAGMLISPDGVLRGTTTRVGRFAFRVGYVNDLGAGTQNYVLIVESGPATQFHVNPQQSTVTAGVPFVVQLTALDAFGNTVTNYSTSTVSFIQYNYNPGNNSPVTLTNLTWSNGIGTATVIVQKATVTPTDPFGLATLIATAGSVSGSGGTLTINPGPVSKFGFLISSSARAGDSIQFVLSAEDQFGNRVVPTYSTPQVTFTRGDGAVLIRDSMGPWSASLANATIRTFKAGPVTLIATAGTVTGSTSITINPRQAVALRVVAPATAFVNEPFGAEVRALDEYENIDTTYNASAKLYALRTSTALVLGNVNLANGTATTSITLSTLGSYTLIAVNNSGPQLQLSNTFVNVLAPLIVPAYSSLPGAPVSVYLDFNGHFESGWRERRGTNTFTFPPFTTPAYDMDGDPNTFTAGELADIEAIWKLVVEDYAPFRVNVTTVDPGDFSNGKALRVAIGGNGAWYVFNPNATGVASINGFTDSGSNTAFVFSVKLRTAKNVGEISSHEAGHGFGLFHQSDFSTNPITEYYAGPGDGRAPIMGYPLDGIRSLWWYGPALTPSTPQDDMAVLSRSENGFGYRPDEAGENASTAASLTVSGNNVSGAGVITRTTDLDYWSFTTGAGFVSFTVSVPEGINNLDAKVALTNASGTLVTAWQDPTFGFGAAVSATLPAGSYRLVVGSHGGYGDVGQYTISGTRAGAGLQAALTSSGDSGAGQALTLEQLRLVVAQAIAYWAASVEPYHLGALSTLELHIADLPGSQLGLMFPDAIWIDVDAGGHGWSLDTDPTASARMDLLTVVVHELGHVLGLEHDDDAQGVMSAQLTPGERRLPAVDQSRTALGAPSMHGEADHGQTLPDVPFLPSVTRNIPNFLASVPGPRLDEKWNYPIETRRRSAATALVPPVESSDDVLDAGIRSWLDGDPWPNGAALDAVIDKAALRT